VAYLIKLVMHRIVWRSRSERALLGNLLQFGRALIGQSTELSAYVQDLRADTWHTGEPYTELTLRIEQLAAVVRDRWQLLRVMG
jgi:hypothetical protein